MSESLMHLAPRTRGNSNDRLWFSFFVIPNLSLYTLFVLVPSLLGVIISFCSWNFFGPIKWVGLHNYQRLIHDPEIPGTLVRTLIFLVLGIVPTIFIGFFCAVLVNWKVKGIGIVRTLFFLPITFSTVMAGVVWSALLQPDSGIINATLKKIGITGPGWLNSTQWAIPGLTLMIIWLSLPIVIILYLAGLQRIAPEILEAAQIDGAGAWERLKSIIFPAVSTTTQLVLVLETIAFLGAPLEVALIMTSGCPINSTTTLAYYSYQQAFENRKVGYSSALVIFQFALFLIAAGFVLAIRKYIRSRNPKK
jgi:multiple sugar transport system permease protein